MILFYWTFYHPWVHGKIVTNWSRTQQVTKSVSHAIFEKYLIHTMTNVVKGDPVSLLSIRVLKIINLPQYLYTEWDYLTVCEAKKQSLKLDDCKGTKYVHPEYWELNIYCETPRSKKPVFTTICVQSIYDRLTKFYATTRADDFLQEY